jgi:hypothetical protein
MALKTHEIGKPSYNDLGHIDQGHIDQGHIDQGHIVTSLTPVIKPSSGFSLIP